MMGFGGLLWLIVIIALVIWFVQYNNKKGGNLFGSGKEENSLDILDKRYANGDITKEEYDKMKKDITKKE